MRARELYTDKVPRVRPSARRSEIAQAMLEHGTSCALVVSDDGELLGLVAGYDLRVLAAGDEPTCTATAGEIMTPVSRLVTVCLDAELSQVVELLSQHDVTQLPVVEGGKVLGIIPRDRALDYYFRKELLEKEAEKRNRRAQLIIDSLHEGLVVVDKNLVIQDFNPAAEKLVGLRAVDRIGKKAEAISLRESPMYDVLATGKAQYGVETMLKDGRVFLLNYVPIIEENDVVAVIESFTDITPQKKLQAQLAKARDELDKAFALTLPNSRVEYKLKHTPEYRDLYDPSSRMITVTEIIPDGSYLHVVNALKVAADLNEKGVMNLLGINKDVLVQVFIFHDLGKSQPMLRVGDVVDPKKVFEPGIRHAWRSADIAEHFYRKDADIVRLIRYHHHPEDELPPDFPSALLPMLRLVSLVDGLSAGLTRRDAEIELDANVERIAVKERNAHPDYNRAWGINLYTGEKWPIEQFNAAGPGPSGFRTGEGA